MWNILSLDILNFLWRILIYELFNMHESSSHSDQNLISFLYFDVNPLLTKLIDAFWFSKEEDFEFFTLWIGIDECSKSLINSIFPLRMVYFIFCNFILRSQQFVFIKRFLKLILNYLELIKKLILNRLCFKDFFLDWYDLFVGCSQLFFKVCPCLNSLLELLIKLLELSAKILIAIPVPHLRGF